MRDIGATARIAAILLAAGAICLAAGMAQNPAGAQAPAADFEPQIESLEDLPDAPGREETFYACVACHSFRLVSAQGMERGRWDETLDWMTERHGMAPIDGEERALILDYLATHYPPRAPSRPGGWRNPFAPQ